MSDQLRFPGDIPDVDWKKRVNNLRKKIIVKSDFATQAEKNAIELIDEALGVYPHRDIVSGDEITNLLLDIRQALSQLIVPVDV